MAPCFVGRLGAMVGSTIRSLHCEIQRLKDVVRQWNLRMSNRTAHFLQLVSLDKETSPTSFHSDHFLARERKAPEGACTRCGQLMDGRAVDKNEARALGLLRKVQKVLDVVGKRIAHDFKNPLNVVTILHGVRPTSPCYMAQMSHGAAVSLYPDTSPAGIPSQFYRMLHVSCCTYLELWESLVFETSAVLWWCALCHAVVHEKDSSV
jgi:hypothetical protein